MGTGNVSEQPDSFPESLTPGKNEEQKKKASLTHHSASEEALC